MSWRTDRWRESSSIFDAACGILFLPTCAIGGFFHAPRIIWGQQTPFGQDEKPFLDTGERAVGDTHFCAPDFEVDLIWLLTVLANFRDRKSSRLNSSP